jgi:hypothetical protein
LAIGWIGAAARSAVPFLARIVRGPELSLHYTPAPTALTPLAISDSARSDTLTPPQLPQEAPGLSAEVNCRIFAAQALGRIGPAASSALTDLRDAANSNSDPIRQAAHQAMRQIQGE